CAVMVASVAGVSSGAEGQWLFHSLVVVIIGGLGSIRGAVAGAVLYGMVSAFAPAYLPRDYTYYSIIFTFGLLAIVLAVRPYGLFGRPEGASDSASERTGRHGLRLAGAPPPNRRRSTERRCVSERASLRA